MQDLALDIVFGAMSRGDQFLRGIARGALLGAVNNDLDTIVHRQAVLRDCLARPDVVRSLYALAVEASDERRNHPFFGILSHNAGSVLRGSIEQLENHVGHLRKLRDIATKHAEGFCSCRFRTLFETFDRELGDEYLERVQAHLSELKLREGVLVSAQLGERNEGMHYVLRRPPGPPPSWVERVLRELRNLLPARPRPHVVRVAERDEAGARALSDLKDRGVASVANALAQSAEHIQGFFRMLRTELAFYVGCLNLHEQLAAKGEPTCFPDPKPAGSRARTFRGLHDLSLALTLERRIVGNSGDLDGKGVAIVTGANQGGKSTFLRSVGIAQLMMQSGMFVSAESFAAELCTGLFTHFRREEDASMESGRLDEELRRMSDIADAIAPGAMLLLNESFRRPTSGRGPRSRGRSSPRFARRPSGCSS